MSLSDVFMSHFPRPVESAGGLAARAAGVAPAQDAKVSAFVTVASFANFSTMSGAIAAAWVTLSHAMPGWTWAQGVGLPFLLALAWCLVSLLLSWDELKKSGSIGGIAQALFIGLLNAVVLAGSVVGLVKTLP